MENTTVSSEQNLKPTSIVSDTPQNIVLPEKKSISLWVISTIVLLILFVLSLLILSLYYFKFGLISNDISTTQPTPENNITYEPEPITQSEPDKVPLKNTLYSASYKGSDVIFLTNDKLSEYYEDGIKKTSPMIGKASSAGGGSWEPVKYEELQNPKRLFTYSEGNIYDLGNFAYDSKKAILYVSLLFLQAEKQYPNLDVKIFQINLDKQIGKSLWTHTIGDAKYDQKGPAGVDKVVENKFLAIWLGICNECEGFDPHGTVILNIQTGNEKYLGAIGNLQFNIQNNTVNYQKLNPFKEICEEPGPGCDNDGQRTIYKPSGEIMASQLP